jgi:hypothetical protein
MKLDKKTIIMIICGSIFLFIILFTINKYGNKTTTNEKTENGTYLVSNYSRFFTISGCANKYVGFLSNKNSESLYKLLSKSYIKKHNITKENILSNLDDFGGDIYNFEARKMYAKNINSNTIRYYVYGYLNKQLMDSYFEPKDYYLIIDLDINNSLFSVTPYTGNIFKGVK